MGCKNNCGFFGCECLGVLISIVFGAVIGILFAFGFIPNIVTAVGIALGTSALFLIFLVAILLLGSTNENSILASCCCKNTYCLLAGIIGTFISSSAALAIVLTNTIPLVIALIAIIAFFFSLLWLGLIGFISCIKCKLCHNPIEN